VGRREPRLEVQISTRASRQLSEIWLWNAKRYNPNHADRYDSFLLASIEKIARSSETWQRVGKYRYFVARKGRTKGHGHLFVFEVLQEKIAVLFIFHSAQDWRANLEAEDDVS
jgi:plasmid stabilization system protein ParE